MDNAVSSPAKPRLWVRVLMLVLLYICFYIAAAVLLGVAILQVVLTIVDKEPNERLRSFGAGLGRYLKDIALFASFSSDEMPFPFTEWKTGD